MGERRAREIIYIDGTRNILEIKYIIKYNGSNLSIKMKI